MPDCRMLRAIRRVGEIYGNDMEPYVTILYMGWSATERPRLNIWLHPLVVTAVAISQMNSERIW